MKISDNLVKNMENQAEKEKYTNIRQTIRNVILPLVEAIYNEEPSDIISFCAGYFNDLLIKRYSDEMNTGLNYHEVSPKDEDGGIVENKDSVIETINVSLSNVQGSASEPLLTSDKHSEGLSLRETSSWSSAPNDPGSLAISGCNLADAKCGIGDQPCSKAEQAEILENDEKGDVDINRQREKKTLDNSNHVGNNSCQLTYESTSDEVQIIYESASVSTCERLDEDFKQKSTEEENQKSKIGKREKEIKTEVSESSISDASFWVIDDKPSDEERKIKICSKQLSPNSSFGFIPHLKEYESEEGGVTSESNDDSSSLINTSEDFEELTKRLSVTLQSLAQEFSSAETNFNEEFQNAKEISDIIQRRHETKEMNEYWKLTKVSSYENASSGKKTDENPNFEEASHKQSGDENHELIEDNHISTSESKLKISPKKFLKASPDSKTLDDSESGSTFHFQKNKYLNVNETSRAVTDPSKFESSEVQSLNLSREPNDSTLLQDGRRSYNHEPHQTVDELWRKRWYSGHPRLDIVNDLRQRSPIFFRGHHIFNEIRNATMNNIGEAGDVPQDRFFISEESRNERTSNSSESSHEATSPLPTSEGNLHSSSFSANEARLRENAGRSTHISSEEDQKNANASYVCSPNVPYSWRKLCKPQVRSSENGERYFKQSQMKIDEETLDSENGTKNDFNANVDATQEFEKLSEIIIVEEIEKKTETQTLNENQGMRFIKTEENKEETKISEQPKSYNENIARSHESESYENLNDDKTKTESFNSEVGNPVKSSNESYFKDCFEQQKDRPVGKGNEKFLNLQQIPSSDNYMKKDNEVVSHDASSSVLDNNISEPQRNENLAKAEPGLNSAGGDFSSSIINENNEPTANLQPPNGVREENNANITVQNGTSVDGITTEYVEEVIGRVIQQQEEDSFETLNFSNYSESDKSSDYSEAEDLYSDV